jgi:hypothetical protein
MLSRRRLLASLAAGAASMLGARAARALPKSRFVFAQVTHGGRWDVRPTSLPRLAALLESRTSVDPGESVAAVSLSGASLFRYPFLVLTGEGALPAFTEDEISRLKRFLAGGGFLWIDNAEARPGGDFDKSVRTELARATPGLSLAKIDPKHTLYKSFYLIERPVGRVATTSFAEGIEQDGRLSVVYTQNDLLGAYARSKGEGGYAYDVTPGGEDQRDHAFRMGINIVLYALCLSYKSDGVHVDYLLKRRDWRGDE